MNDILLTKYMGCAVVTTPVVGKIVRVSSRWRLYLAHVDVCTTVLVALTVFTSALIASITAIIVWLSFTQGILQGISITYTLSNYKEVLLNAFTYRVLLNSVIFALISLLIAFLFGLPIAWLTERTDLSGKTLVYTLMTIGLLIPSFAVAMGWLFLLHTRIGVLNRWVMGLLSLSEAPLNIATIPGMGWVQGLSMAPLAFLMCAAIFRAMDPTLEEAAYVNGATPFRTIRSITLPLLRPGILAASIYIISIGITTFDVPAIIGWTNRVFTFSTYIYSTINPQGAVPQYELAATLSTFTILLAIILSWWYASTLARARQYEVVSGKGYQPRLIKLGRWNAAAWIFISIYLILSKVIPGLVLIWASLLRFFEIPSLDALKRLTLIQYETLPWDLIGRGAWNTSILMLLTPTVTVVLSLAFAWVVLRSQIPGRLVLDSFAFLPHVIPSIVFGIGGMLFALFLTKHFLPIYGTVWIMLIVFVIVRLSIGTRMLNSSLIQINRELDEAAYVSGANTWTVIYRILIPIIMPSLLYSWLWIALLTYRELTLATILATPESITLTMVVWSLWMTGGLGQASAVTIIVIAVLMPLIAMYWFLAGKTGIGIHRYI